MNRIPVFMSFDFKHDETVKEQLVREWADDRCPIWIQDKSIPAPVIDQRWQSEAAKRIASAKAVLVVCGHNTHSADGVIAEVQMGIQQGKPIVYLRARGAGSSLPRGVSRGAAMTDMDWDSVAEALAPYANK